LHGELFPIVSFDSELAIRVISIAPYQQLATIQWNSPLDVCLVEVDQLKSGKVKETIFPVFYEVALLSQVTVLIWG